ncbi:hypothetical protein Dimus_024071, partial [Dionaea muscipula]
MLLYDALIVGISSTTLISLVDIVPEPWHWETDLNSSSSDLIRRRRPWITCLQRSQIGSSIHVKLLQLRVGIAKIFSTDFHQSKQYTPSLLFHSFD